MMLLCLLSNVDMVWELDLHFEGEREKKELTSIVPCLRMIVINESRTHLGVWDLFVQVFSVVLISASVLFPSCSILV